MKKLIWMGAFVLWPVFASGQSNLYFTKVFTPNDLQSTGFAILNPGPTNANVTYALYGIDGLLLATASRQINARNQLARLGSELFPSAPGSGWVEVSSPTSGLQGFWLSGDFVNLNRADGAVSAPLTFDQVFPFFPIVSDLSIINPNPVVTTVNIRAYSESGAEIGNTPRMIPARGILQVALASIIQSGTLAYLRVTGNPGFAASIVVRGISSLDNAVYNGIDASLASQTETTLVFPHFIDGASGALTYSSFMSIVNLSTRALNVRYQFFPEEGGPPVESEQFLAPQAQRKGIAPNFFSYPEFLPFHNGYVKVTADGPIAGVVDYGAPGEGGEAVVPALLTPQTAVLFSHIADLFPWYTGLAIQNPSNAAANVEVYAMNPNNTLIGGAANVPTARFTLAPGAKTAKLLSELIPQTQTRTGPDGGFVFVRTTNGVPIHAIQLFFTRDLKALANVSGAGLPPGITYVPPTP
jgi:hypothetical protein